MSTHQHSTALPRPLSGGQLIPADPIEEAYAELLFAVFSGPDSMGDPLERTTSSRSALPPALSLTR